VFPDTTGIHLSEGADIQGDDQTVQAVLSVFTKAREAVIHKDIDGLMALYSENYLHGGYTKQNVREVWNDLFAKYDDFSGTHTFAKIQIQTDKRVPAAHVTCTGSLWATSNKTNQRVHIDSWTGEVHHLISERGAWYLAGTYWEIPPGKESRPSFKPHPFF
jgi:ketosteroid isomerase-like protein